MGIVIKPLEDYISTGFEKAEPARQRNNPEIFILCNLAKGIHEFYLHRVRLGDNDFFLCPRIDENNKSNTGHGNEGIEPLINSQIIHIAVCDLVCYERGNEICYGGRKRVNHALDSRGVCTLLGIRREHVNQIFISVIEKIIEKL